MVYCLMLLHVDLTLQFIGPSLELALTLVARIIWIGSRLELDANAPLEVCLSSQLSMLDSGFTHLYTNSALDMTREMRQIPRSISPMAQLFGCHFYSLSTVG